MMPATVPGDPESLAATPVVTASHDPHELHRIDRVWPETNCYVDLWIELLHSLGTNPCAMLAFTVAIDFEGDQWTFFKPPLSDLHTLYGIDVQELTVWRSLPLQIAEQVSLGRPVLVEVDAFFLPDTRGISYDIQHAKTTIAVTSIDTIEHRLGYFHNAGFFELGRADYDGLFEHTSLEVGSSAVLAPYAEIAKLERIVHRSEDELCAIAHELTTQHLRRCPSSNPVTRYRERFERDVAWLTEQDMGTFYQYAFATLRQCGACAELASSFFGWLDSVCGDKTAAAGHFDTMAAAAKSLQFKVARAVSTKKPGDFNATLDAMERAWDGAMEDLVARYGG